jgi:hypothetical protein
MLHTSQREESNNLQSLATLKSVVDDESGDSTHLHIASPQYGNREIPNPHNHVLPFDRTGMESTLSLESFPFNIYGAPPPNSISEQHYPLDYDAHDGSQDNNFAGTDYPVFHTNEDDARISTAPEMVINDGMTLLGGYDISSFLDVNLWGQQR